MQEKDIFISYAEDDEETAVGLREVLQEWFGDRVWVRFFDLNSGDLIVNVLDNAMTEAKWFIILLSKAALESEWVRLEARFGTFRSLRSDDFKIVIVHLEECEYPKHLKIALLKEADYIVVDLTKEADCVDGFMRVANSIEEMKTTASTQSVVYEGRGADTDKFLLAARRNKILFVVGWHGIGKTAFVLNSVESAIRNKRIYSVNLTHGHSRDLLARQIIKQMHEPQPMSEQSLSDHVLMAKAIDALRKRAHFTILFLDSAQAALDESNRLLPYLKDFLTRFQTADIDTKIILATARNPDFSEEISKITDVYRLGPLEDEYVREIIYQWLEGHERESMFLHWSNEAEQLVKMVGGHPLAAKRMATFLKVKTPEQLLTTTRRERFQLGFAEYILRATQSALSDLHCLILQVLAVIQEPISLSDMLAVKTLTRRFSLEEIHQAMWELSDLLLIEQSGELVYLHGFLTTYYSRQLRNDPSLRKSIASDFGHYACGQARDLNAKLDEIQQVADDQVIIKLSNEIFRYSISADRLLRLVGKEDLADKLPIRTKGVLRGLVYYFYQDAADYPRALEYAEKWLRLNPDDSDIKLYQIRCYRRLRDKDSLAKARRLISAMEGEDHKLQVHVRLVREKAIVADQEGDIEVAKSLFRQAINMDTRRRPYSEVYAGLARLLLREADNLYDWDARRPELASEAVGLLEIAKNDPDNFYRFHLDAYVEALIQVGKEDVAEPLLREALGYRPDDGKLNFRMAEIQRRNGQYEQAKHYADLAFKNGYTSGLLIDFQHSKTGMSR